MDPISFASGVSLVASAGSKVLGGIGQSQAAAMQAERAQAAAFAAKTNALNTDNQYLMETRKSLASIDAIRASAGDNIDSPTGLALKDEMQSEYDKRRETAVQNYRNQEAQDLMDASYFKSQSSNFLTTGLLGGLTGLVGQGAKGFGNWFNQGSGSIGGGM